MPDALNSVDHIAGGLEAGPYRYIAAISLFLNLVLVGLMVRDRRRGEEKSERLGAILEKQSQAVIALRDVAAFVAAQLPRKRGMLGPEPTSGVHPLVKP